MTSAPAVSRKVTQRAPRRGTGGITVMEVARVAGVSAITVSRALNTPNQVSEQTLQKVRAAIDRTGYVPNLLAGALASNRSRLVAMLVPTIAGSVFLETIQALTDTLAAHGVHLMLAQIGYQPDREDEVLAAIIGRRPDGIVLTGVSHSDEMRQRLRVSGIPVVETWDLTDDPIDMLIGFSHQHVGEQAAEFLLTRCAASRVAVISADDPRAAQRRDAFVAKARAMGMTEVAVQQVAAPSAMLNGRHAMARLLDQGPRPDAVFCSSDVLALGALAEAQARGLSVPGQIQVLGFGDHPLASAAHPALTTIRIDGAQIGALAAQHIVARRGRHETDRPLIDIGFQIVVRATCRV